MDAEYMLGAEFEAWSLQQARPSLFTPTSIFRPSSTQGPAAPSIAGLWVKQAAQQLRASLRPLTQFVRRWQLLEPAAFTPSLARHVTWSRTTTAILATAAVTELVVLPAWAPGGMCGGSLLAEGAAWGLLGTATDLGSLLAGSKDLEQVQAFSLARKLGQMVMLQGALSLALGAASRRSRSQLFNFSWARPLQPGSLGCGALALNAVLCQSLGHLLHTLLPPLAGLPGLGLDSWVEQWSSGGQGASCLAVGDERSLPARCRWWVESCVAAPVLEETLFRGFLLASFTRWLPAWGAVLASSALFTACHLGSLAAQDLPQVLGAGVVLGLLYLRSGSLLAPVAAHSFTNTLALLTS
ncbi:hypothetical protein QJQ45_005341 [Haematococcus lacustris]|nr:hypothetical protein QJQ45_005341 [Haematococcus lacustris]